MIFVLNTLDYRTPTTKGTYMKIWNVFVLSIIFIISNASSLLAYDLLNPLSGVQLHGFISQGYVFSKSHNFLFDDIDHGSFEFNELGVTVSKKLNDRLHLGIQFFSRDQGNIGNNDLVVDWAYADYHYKDYLGIRVGKLKMPLGFYNETRDIDILRTCIFLPQSAYLEYYRDVLGGLHGIGFYGNLPLDWGSDISYQFLAGTLKIDQNGGVTTLLNNEASIETHPLLNIHSYSVNNCINGMIVFSPFPGLKLGSSFIQTATKVKADLNPDLMKTFARDMDYTLLYYKGLIDPDSIMLDRIEKGTLAMFAGSPLEAEVDNVLAFMHSVELSIDRLVIMMEYYNYTYDIKLKIPDSLTLFDNDFFTIGYYANMVYRFSDMIETGIYYSVLQDNGWDPSGDRFAQKGEQRHQTWLKDLSLSIRFDLNDSWTFKLENHWMNGTAFLMHAHNPDKRYALGQYWQMFAAKMTF
ncbi:MAG: hypothetical protein OMM_06643, partial [Candidatus Magnetoglobus multicellularis str. Araruama]